MLLNEKISAIRKMNNMSQEAFAEELGVSRQAVSKWETGSSVPDVQLLLRIADFYNITLDQLIRDEFDLPVSQADSERLEKEETDTADFDIEKYLGKVCDVSMNSFNFSVIRNVKIVGSYKNMVCFEKKGRYGWFNHNKSLGILIKKEEDYQPHNVIDCLDCTAYANKGTYFGGMTYAFSKVEKVSDDGIGIQTGKFYAEVSWDDISVILYRDRY
jgi:transcriptional regulator with XRE-family HTH domain